MLHLLERRRRFCLAIEDDGIIVPRRVEARRELEAPFQQVFGIHVAAQSGGDLRQHPQRRHIGGMHGEMGPQERIGDR